MRAVSSAPSPGNAKVVVLTGASSGIGRATALAFAEEGARLVLAARGREALGAVAVECRAAGADVLAVPTDVTDAAAVRQLAEDAIRHFGAVDVWINNVGVGAIGRFELTPIESHRRVIEANLLGHLHGAYAVLPHFRQRGRGTLINMISIGGFVPAPYAAAYTASKFGLRGLSESLRAELSDAPGIHVCEVYPTFVDTPGVSHGANYTGRRVRPTPPLLDPRRVAAVLVSLARSPRPSVQLGSVALPGRLAHALAPGLLGRFMNRIAGSALNRAHAAEHSDGNLFAPSRNTAIDGGFRKPLPAGTVAIAGTAALVGLGVAWWWHARHRHRTPLEKLQAQWRRMR
jgi:NAD(P)-dependent dehydrogenase (short-subunit alcohol dehydrogenase family)